ncbi:hypothetical protein DINM_003950 [Dirofilaria immitis]|nr:hypothetical protein [Dirofilaria immitis]
MERCSRGHPASEIRIHCFRTCSSLFTLKRHCIAQQNSPLATLGSIDSVDGFPFVDRDPFINESFLHILFAVNELEALHAAVEFKEIDAHSFYSYRVFANDSQYFCS